MRFSTWWNSAVILLLRSALWTVLLPGLIAGYIPWWVFGFRMNDLSGATDALGIVVLLFGVTVLTLCIVEFALRGKGTLSPLDPARQLVVTGLYRWVRNPMYVGVVFILAGEVLISGSTNLALYTLTFVFCTTVFIIGFEEPYLERSFGLSYADYKRHVRRWIPRLTPWNPREGTQSRNCVMRKQYFFRPSSRGLLAWDVDRLIELSAPLPRRRIPLAQIRELDERWFGDSEPQTWRAMLEHIRLIDEADLSFPIILASNGAVMDGMHRVAKAALRGNQDIEAVQFTEDPRPDFVGRQPEDLSY